MLAKRWMNDDISCEIIDMLCMVGVRRHWMICIDMDHLHTPSMLIIGPLTLFLPLLHLPLLLLPLLHLTPCSDFHLLLILAATPLGQARIC